MGKHFSIEFKEKVLKDYKSGKFGGYPSVARKYEISQGTINHWIKKIEFRETK